MFPPGELFFLGNAEVRKGAAAQVSALVEKQGGQVPPQVGAIVDEVSEQGGTPLVVAELDGGVARVLGVIRLSDVVKPGMVVMDIGSNIGAFTIPLARMVGAEGNVIELAHLAHSSEFGEAETSAVSDADTDRLHEVVQRHLRAEALSGTVDAYACGPPPMIDAVLPVLQMNAVDLDHIYFDRFTPAVR